MLGVIVFGVVMVVSGEPPGASAAATQHALEERANLCAIAAERGTPTPVVCLTPTATPTATLTFTPSPVPSATPNPEPPPVLPDFAAQSLNDPARAEDTTLALEDQPLPTEEPTPAPEPRAVSTETPVPVRPDPAAAPVASKPVAAVAPQPAPLPTYTPYPTYTPVATSTARSSSTPTQTAVATKTPAPLFIVRPAVSPVSSPVVVAKASPPPATEGHWDWFLFGKVAAAVLSVFAAVVFFVARRRVAVWKGHARA